MHLYMEGKAMKKKIILFLSFLIIVMCLTGCTKEYVIQKEKIEEITKIANNVVTQKGYELPEGYTVSYPDNTTNARIKISDNTKISRESLDVVFDISKEEIKLIEISVSSSIPALIMAIVVYVGGTIALGFFIISEIKKITKKIKEKVKGKKNKVE